MVSRNWSPHLGLLPLGAPISNHTLNSKPDPRLQNHTPPQALLDRGVLQGREVAHILETNGVIHFPDPFTGGFGWDETGGCTLRVCGCVRVYRRAPKVWVHACVRACVWTRLRHRSGACSRGWWKGVETLALLGQPGTTRSNRLGRSTNRLNHPNRRTNRRRPAQVPFPPQARRR